MKATAFQCPATGLMVEATYKAGHLQVELDEIQADEDGVPTIDASRDDTSDWCQKVSGRYPSAGAAGCAMVDAGAEEDDVYWD